jgi:hypothetical protein
MSDNHNHNHKCSPRGEEMNAEQSGGVWGCERQGGKGGEGGCHFAGRKEERGERECCFDFDMGKRTEETTTQGVGGGCIFFRKVFKK